MTPRTRKVIAQIASFFLAGVLLYFALRGVDLYAVGRALRAADYRWLAPLGVVVLISHLLRAWRWKILLEALPKAPERVSLKSAFYAVMIGYMVNYAAPRLGEAARTASMATQESMSFSSVLGTVVAERILDVVVLALALASVALLLMDRASVIRALFVTPVGRELEGLSIAALIGVLGVVVVLVFLTYRTLLRYGDTTLRGFWDRRLRPVLGSFKEGMSTLVRAPQRPTIVLTTLAMWGCYLLMAHIPFVMLGMAETYDLSLVDSWSIMNLGAIGVVVPSPGGTGSYHYITIQTLVYLFDVAQAPAATYAVLTHGAQLILYVVAGFICLLLQGSSVGSLRRTTRNAQQTAASSHRADASYDPSSH